MPIANEKKIASMIAGGTVALIILLYLFKGQGEISSPTPQGIRVKASTLKYNTSRPYINLHGTTETLQLTTLKATFDTDITDTFTFEGDKVKKGQTLLSLNCTDPELELKKVLAQEDNLEQSLNIEKNNLSSTIKSLDHEKKLLTLIKRSMKRHQSLYNKQLGSEANLDSEKQRFHEQSLKINQTELNIKNYESKIKLIESDLDENKHQQALIEHDISYCQLKAPYDGIVLKRYVSKGDRVNKDATLITLFDNTKIVIRTQIPKQYVPALNQARHSGKALLAFDSLKRKYMIRSFNFDSRNLHGSFELLLVPEHVINFPILGHVDQFALLLPEQKHSYKIPTKAIYNNNHVYKIIKGHLQSASIKVIGPAWDPKQAGSETIVTSTQLLVGDQILTTPLPQARSGLTVEIGDDHTIH